MVEDSQMGVFVTLLILEAVRVMRQPNCQENVMSDSRVR